jgi:D-3-phosphoglycerate dehydrogenase
MVNDMRPLIVITATPETPVRVDIFRETLGDWADIDLVPLPFRLDSEAEQEQYWQRIYPAAALFVRTGLIPAQLIARCPHLKVITLHGAGVDQVDVASARAAGVMVTNIPGANAPAVAEMTIGLMLAVLRQIPLADRRLRTASWEQARQSGRELRGQRVGLVGFGNIARRVAHLLRAFGAEVAYYDLLGRNSDPQFADCIFLPLPELLASSDIVSLHLPLTEETHHLISAQRLASFKPGSILINTARGPIVDQAALYEALTSGRLAAAALDVFDPEPLSSDSPLLSLDNVVVTPHLAGSTDECLIELARRGALEIARVLRGEAALYTVGNN